MGKHEFLQLAHKYDSKKYYIGNWLLSEKLDGIRAFYDGGISRGLPVESVPWANTEKDYRYKNEIVATGLWSRYRKTIQAPDWLLDQLPPYPLDIELWSPAGWQTTSSIVKQLNPDGRWRDIKLMVLDSPNINIVLRTYVNSVKDYIKIAESHPNFKGIVTCDLGIPLEFERIYNWLKRDIIETDNLKILEQHRLSSSTKEAHTQIEDYLNEIVGRGGEGVVLRKPTSIWTPQRSHECLKYKPYSDDEAVVKSYVWGKETDKGSKLMGLMGCLVTDYKGKRFELSGFSDEERRMILVGDGDENEGFRNPGKEVSSGWTNPSFPRGSVVTFRYRELSDGGIPKESRYLRKP